MLRIPSVPPPAVLTTMALQGAAYREVSSDKSIRQALWMQQGKRCAYCERILRDPERVDHRTKIEHFHPQSGGAWNDNCERASGASDETRSATAWSNLLLCCDGNELARVERTCDTSKGNTDICGGFRNPKSWHAPSLVIIDDNGRAHPAGGLPSEASTVVDQVLNLNSPELVRARKNVLGARRKRIAKSKAVHQGWTGHQRSEIAAVLRRDAGSSEYGSTLISLADRLERPR
jgi:uncharacterized protein (TIGR02646 family)